MTQDEKLNCALKILQEIQPDIEKAKNEKQNQDFHLPLIQATNSIL